MDLCYLVKLLFFSQRSGDMNSDNENSWLIERLIIEVLMYFSKLGINKTTLLSIGLLSIHGKYTALQTWFVFSGVITDF